MEDLRKKVLGVVIIIVFYLLPKISVLNLHIVPLFLASLIDNHENCKQLVAL